MLLKIKCIALQMMIFAEKAEEEEIKEQANQEQQAKQTTQTKPMMSAQPGKGKAGPKTKPKNPKSFQTKPVPPKPNHE